MDSVFLDLVRGEFESTMSWLAAQCEQHCDRVGTDSPGCAIDAKDISTSDKFEKYVEVGRGRSRDRGRSGSSVDEKREFSSRLEETVDGRGILEGRKLDKLRTSFRENSEYVFVASCIFRELSQRGISSLCDMLEELYERLQ